MSARCASISSADSTLVRAAASSIASGRPSSSRQIRATTAAGAAAPAPGRAEAPRVRNSRTAAAPAMPCRSADSGGTASGGTG